MKKPTNSTGRLTKDLSKSKSAPRTRELSRTKDLPKAELPHFAERKTSMLRNKARMRRKRLSFLFLTTLGILFLGMLVGLIVRFFPVHFMGKPLEAQNVLILGIDYNYDPEGRKLTPNPECQRTDTIFVAHLDPANHTVNVLSLPRDTRVLIPGHGINKLNAAHAFDGPRLAKETIESLLDIEINRYVRIDLNKAQELLGLVGGLDLFVEAPMQYTDRTAGLTIDLKPGWQRLNAKDAIAYARFRHDALGDIGRVHRQQLVLAAIQKKLANPLNWWRVPRLLSSGFACISTDMTFGELSQLVNFAKNRARLSTRFATLPGDFGHGGYWLPSISRISALKETFFTPPKEESAECRTEILYAPNQEARAESLVQSLTQAGIQVIHSRPLEDPQPSKVITYGQSPSWEAKLKGFLPALNWQLSDEPSSYSANFTVILGTDL